MRKILPLVLLFVVFIFLPRILDLYIDWIWFTELELGAIFTTVLKAKLLVGGGAALAIFAIFAGSMLIFRKVAAHKPIMVTVVKNGQMQAVNIGEKINKAIIPISLVLGFLGGIAIAPQWDVVLKYLHQTPFGTIDPIFGRDIAYYIFSVPFFELVIGVLFLVLFISFAVAVALYVSQGALVFKNRANLETPLSGSLLTMSKDVKSHLALLIALWFLLSALNTYYVRMPGLLYSESGSFFGASYTDIHATLPYLYVLFAVSILGAFVSIASMRKQSIKGIASVLVLLIGTQLIGGGLIPSLVQGVVVKPNELVKETEYIQYHIDATQQAWGLDAIEKRNIASESSLSEQDIVDNATTIKNIRLWDRGPLLDTFGQIQEIRTYYDFISIDDDRYTIGDDYRQVLVSPRELNSAALPQRNFINERLTFTHGMGATLSPVNEVTEEGLPVLFTQDLPPKTEYDELSITQPEIYYGELANDYVFVNTEAKEFDYPSGEENIYATYDGTGGVQINSIFHKALFAIHFGSLKIFLSNDISNESRIMYYRIIGERLQKTFPYLKFDSDPYIVIHEGKLTWIQDAYTTTNRYPYSIRVDNNINYMRNSVKLTVDAYNGTINAYVTDETDPLIKTYTEIFPDVFKAFSEIPESLVSHIRYPEDIFAYQSVLYTTYHMDQSQIFYNKEDQWEIPVISSDSRRGTVGPIMRHLIMKLPDGEEEEFILMLPFTPRNKDNMSAWMVARSDKEHYGELIVYRFPKQSLVFGPQQIVNRINQDSEISAQISLWDQRGSEVIQGNLFVIPINESILYVRPLYLRAEGGRIPELKRVIVAYNNQIAMEETLDVALSRIFGGTIPTQSTSVQSGQKTLDQSDLIKKANNHFNAAQSALRRSNWAQYGEEMRQLEEVLKQLK